VNFSFKLFVTHPSAVFSKLVLFIVNEFMLMQLLRKYIRLYISFEKIYEIGFEL